MQYLSSHLGCRSSPSTVPATYIPTFVSASNDLWLPRNVAQKGAAAENYRPITCLPVMWKLLTGIMFEKLYEFLDAGNILPDEKKASGKGPKGPTTNCLLIK